MPHNIEKNEKVISGKQDLGRKPLKTQCFQGFPLPNFVFLGRTSTGIFMDLGIFALFGNSIERVLLYRCRKEVVCMRKKGFKGRCEKRTLGKCKEVCRTYSPIQYAYADILQQSEDVQEIRCNVWLEGLPKGEYTTDFVCIRTDGDMMVRECVERKHLTKPMTVRLLDASREYWHRHGVSDWGLVVDEEE